MNPRDLIRVDTDPTAWLRDAHPTRAHKRRFGRVGGTVLVAVVAVLLLAVAVAL